MWMNCLRLASPLSRVDQLHVRPLVTWRGTRRWWLLGFAVLVVGTGIAAWLRLTSCQYRESSPSYSPDGRFYTQLEMTMCTDSAQSTARLVMGTTGRTEKSVIIDVGRDAEVNLTWGVGPTLHIRTSHGSVTRQYGPYPDLPPVVVE